MFQFCLRGSASRVCEKKYNRAAFRLRTQSSWVKFVNSLFYSGKYARDILTRVHPLESISSLVQAELIYHCSLASLRLSVAEPKLLIDKALLNRATDHKMCSTPALENYVVIQCQGHHVRALLPVTGGHGRRLIPMTIGSKSGNNSLSPAKRCFDSISPITWDIFKCHAPCLIIHSLDVSSLACKHDPSSLCGSVLHLPSNARRQWGKNHQFLHKIASLCRLWKVP